jgi:tyrosine-protein phosphatase SIW14
MKKIFLFLFMSGLVSSTSYAEPTPTKIQIPNFHLVSDSIFRGGRPSADGITWLAQNHVKTDIDLENDERPISVEQTLATNAGVQFVSFPMNAYATPSDDTVNQILELMGSPDDQPVFVHCHHGENRTGLIVALFRVLNQGWTSQAAYNEMMTDGFSMGGNLVLLPYFERKTGYRP